MLGRILQEELELSVKAIETLIDPDIVSDKRLLDLVQLVVEKQSRRILHEK